MADHGIFLKFTTPDIVGSVKAEGHDAWMEALSVQFSASAHGGSVGAAGAGAAHVRASVEQSEVTLTVRGGKWVPEVWQHFFDATEFGKVEIHQVVQVQDKAKKEKTIKANTLDLTKVYITSLSEAFSPDGDRTFSMSLTFEKLAYAHNGTEANDTKMASFNRFNTRAE